MIFAEHKNLLIENSLLNKQVANFEELTTNLLAVDTLRQVQVAEYKQLSDDYLSKINELNSKIKSKNAKLTCWKVGGITVSVALAILLILK